MADNKGRVGLPGEDIIASQLFGRSIDAAPGGNANLAKIGDFLNHIQPVGQGFTAAVIGKTERLCQRDVLGLNVLMIRI